MQNFTCKSDIFSGYGKKVLIGLLLTLTFSLTSFSQSNFNQESSDIIIYGDVRLYIDSLEELTTHGSLTGIDGAVIENNGTFIFNVNDNFQSLYNYSSDNLFTGDGIFVFNGDADFYVGGDFENRFYNLWIDKSDRANVYLENNLGVLNRLNLLGGRIVTGADYRTAIYNSDSSAIRLSAFASSGNSNYIQGNLRRYINAGSGYHFPVGLENTYFPLRVNNSMQGVQYLDVNFSDDVVLTGEVNFQQGLYNFQDLNQTGAWYVAGDNQPSSGSMDITAFIFDFIEQPRFETNMFGLVYNANPLGYTDEWTLEGQYEMPGMNARLAGSDSTLLYKTNKMGYYTVGVADITKLINFISPGDGRETRFIIPTIERYETTELIVYNAMGREIFKDKPYKNNLDMKDFKDGTYYYIFKYTRNGKPGVIQSFIDVKRVY